MANYSVFISFKYSDGGVSSREYQLGLEVFDRLAATGVPAYFFPVSLASRPKSDYSRAIDEALDQATVLIVIGTSVDNLHADWVRYEWDSFLNDVRSGRKAGAQLFTLLEGIGPPDLPRALRQHQSFDAIDLGRLCETVTTLLTADLVADSEPDEAGSDRDGPVASIGPARYLGFRRSPTVDDCGDLVRTYASRSRANQALRMDELIADAELVDMSGISLNFICQQFPSDRVIEMVERGCRVRLLFLDPDSEAMAIRERDERYSPGRLSALTDLNITTLVELRARLSPAARPRLDIRTGSATVVFNSTILDQQLCIIQPYLPETRGVDSPTMVMVRRSNDGLFNTFATTFEGQWSKAAER